MPCLKNVAMLQLRKGTEHQSRLEFFVHSAHFCLMLLHSEFLCKHRILSKKYQLTAAIKFSAQPTPTWGHWFAVTTRLSIVNTNAAVFPVPLCDWAIMFAGLQHTAYIHTHIRLTAFFPGQPGWAGTRKVNHSGFYWSKRWWGSSSISWTICKSFAPHSRQIIYASTPSLNFFTGRMLFLMPNQQCQSTEGIYSIQHTHAYMKTLKLQTSIRQLNNIRMRVIAPLLLSCRGLKSKGTTTHCWALPIKAACWRLCMTGKVCLPTSGWNHYRVISRKKAADHNSHETWTEAQVW